METEIIRDIGNEIMVELERVELKLLRRKLEAQNEEKLTVSSNDGN